jgi:hypothetical protein
MKCQQCSSTLEFDFTICPKCGADSRKAQFNEGKSEVNQFSQIKALYLKYRYRSGLILLFIFSIVLIRHFIHGGRGTEYEEEHFVRDRDRLDSLMILVSYKGGSGRQMLELADTFLLHNPQFDSYRESFRNVPGGVWFTDVQNVEAIRSSPDYFHSRYDFEEIKEQVSLENGASPFDGVFGEGVYNKALSNYIQINNGSESDVVVLVKEHFSGKVIRNEYVRRGSNFKMTSISNGTYYLQYYYGRDWSTSVSTYKGVEGGFLLDESFQSSNKYADAIKMEQDATHFSTIEIDLQKRIGGNMETQSIDESDFFNY